MAIIDIKIEIGLTEMKSSVVLVEVGTLNNNFKVDAEDIEDLISDLVRANGIIKGHGLNKPNL